MMRYIMLNEIMIITCTKNIQWWYAKQYNLEAAAATPTTDKTKSNFEK